MTRAPLPSELVACPWCGAKVEEHCTDGAGRVAQQSHRARVLLSCVGSKSEAAVARIEKILADNAKRASTAAKNRALKEQQQQEQQDG